MLTASDQILELPGYVPSVIAIPSPGKWKEYIRGASTSSGKPLSQVSSATDPEVIDGFIAEVRQYFDYVLATTAFSACSLTLLVVLLAFSTQEFRRRLVFRLNVLAICVAITLGVLVGLAGGKAMMDPFNQVSKSVYIASVVIAHSPPVLYDSILLTRLFALYPISATPATTLLKIFAFPFCVKCTRVIVLSIGLNEYVSCELTTVTLEEDEATA